MSELSVLLESWNKVKELDIYKQDIIGVNMMIWLDMIILYFYNTVSGVFFIS